MIEWIVSSSVLILAVVILRLALRRRISQRLQYALWALVLVRLLVPVSFGSTGLSVMNALEKAPAAEAPLYVWYTGDIGAAPPDEPAEAGSGSVPAAAAPEPGVRIAPYTGEIPANTTGIRITSVLKTLWLTGSALFALALLFSNLGFAARLRRTRREYSMARRAPLRVYVSPEVETPCLFGLFRPAVYITPEAAENETVLRHALEHEITHFRHGDHIWALLRCLCLVLHWYNPLVWLAAFLSRRDAELACDEGTIKRLGEGERAGYGNALIDLTCCEKRGAAALFCTATTMTGGKGCIRERITLIAKKPKMLWITAVAVVLIAAAAVGCTFTGANTSSPQPGDAAEVEPSETQPPEVGQEASAALPPAEALDSLFGSDDHIDLTLYLAGEGACGTYSAGSWYKERFAVLLGGYEWTELAAPTTEPDDFWLTAASADGLRSLTFRSSGEGGTLQYSDGDTDLFWSASPPYDSSVSIAGDIRAEYDNLDVDFTRIAFYLDDSAEKAAERFVQSAYGEHMLSLEPGSLYGVSDCEIVDWEILQVSEDGDAVLGQFECAVTPLDHGSPALWAGNTAEGTGALAGKLVYSRQFVLQKQEDGLWRCTDLGTGGASLPE